MTSIRLEELGERTRFITSRDGEERGWVRLREASEFARGSAASEIEARVHQQNEAVGEEIRAWLQRIDWRTFESTFLTRILEALGFQDVQITQATRDGGADARVVYQRGVVGARAIVSAKRWTARTVPVDEVRMMRGVKGEEDTATIVTTGRFSADAQNEAKPGQNQRVVYLIDGEKLIEICKRNQIGVKMVPLPGLLVLDPEVAREAPVRDDSEAAEEGAESDDLPERNGLTISRLQDEMLGDPERGLSVEEIAEFTGYKVNTVRVYLYDAQRRKAPGDAIRGDQKSHSRALALVSLGVNRNHPNERGGETGPTGDLRLPAPPSHQKDSRPMGDLQLLYLERGHSDRSANPCRATRPAACPTLWRRRSAPPPSPAGRRSAA